MKVADKKHASHYLIHFFSAVYFIRWGEIETIKLAQAIFTCFVCIKYTDNKVD